MLICHNIEVLGPFLAVFWVNFMNIAKNLERNGNFPDDANYRFLVIAKGKNVPDATNDRKFGMVQHKF